MDQKRARHMPSRDAAELLPLTPLSQAIESPTKSQSCDKAGALPAANKTTTSANGSMRGATIRNVMATF